jgi:predicted SprT family Zn-dependent metalloprotease
MVGSSLRQLLFSFVDTIAQKRSGPRARVKPKPVAVLPEPASVQVHEVPMGTTLMGRDLRMERQCKEWLTTLGLHEGSMKVQVIWNAKLRSTAGYAKWPQWQIELNPRLVEFEGQVERTLKHELAHLIAYARANRRRIEPHGAEWRRACADLGIPDESARHTLPLPRTTQTRKFTYHCPSCSVEVERVRKFRQRTACLHCCKKHAGGRFDSRFQFELRK